MVPLSIIVIYDQAMDSHDVKYNVTEQRMMFLLNAATEREVAKCIDRSDCTVQVQQHSRTGRKPPRRTFSSSEKRSKFTPMA
jgi:hypothetical protein